MHNNRETVIIPQTIIVTTKSIIVASLEMSFQVLLVRDSAFRIGMGRSFHQSRTVNENVRVILSLSVMVPRGIAH